ncbi:unnamed protein product [Cuscuta epithymum]|uniref:Hyaluronan/mRNA-binding protein domain-containing protein n=1 Tax=Cuscuta epithymum TaxID=186058 RepID=A0AAV0CN78_9ASTE|nr:unnamed protein product [Cuscuta epithymum]
MTTLNPFDLLVDDDTDDLSQLVAKLPLSAPASKKAPAQVQPAKPLAKMPTKPLPPSEAVREVRNEYQRGGGRSGSRGGMRGRGGRGRSFNNESDNENSFGGNNGFSGGYRPPEDGEGGKTYEKRGDYAGGPRGGFRGVRRGGFGAGVEDVDGERPRRVYERRSGTGRGNEFKREGAGRANWGTPTDEIAQETEEPVIEVEKSVETEKQHNQEDAGDASKDVAPNESEEKEPEEKEMTLDEYEKLLEEKRKALLALKPEERKVDFDKEFESMQLLSNKKNDDDVIFVKLGSDKEKKKEVGEKAKKTKNITEFLKPAEGENYYRPGGRGRGGRGGRGRFGDSGRGSGYVGNRSSVDAPSIEDVGQFPTLGSK